MSKRITLMIISFIFLIKIIQTQNCSTIQPSIRYDCFKYSDSENYCCFKGVNENCALIKKDAIQSNNSNYDCGISDHNYGLYEFEEYHPRPSLGLPFQGCGEKSPDKKEDCLEYSEISNSCCFFKDKNGNKGCYSIGRRYIGDLKEKKFEYNSDTITYECNSFNIIFKFYFIFFLIILSF